MGLCQLVWGDALSTNSQAKGNTIPNYIKGIYKALDNIHVGGARIFAIMRLVCCSQLHSILLLKGRG
jgi:hypothetical protein